MTLLELIYELVKHNMDDHCNKDTTVAIDGENFYGGDIKRIYYDSEVNQICIRTNEKEAMD